jgi:hypothetical protein
MGGPRSDREIAVENMQQKIHENLSRASRERLDELREQYGTYAVHCVAEQFAEAVVDGSEGVSNVMRYIERVLADESWKHPISKSVSSPPAQSGNSGGGSSMSTTAPAVRQPKAVDEFRARIDEQTQANIARGMAPMAARSRAFSKIVGDDPTLHRQVLAEGNEPPAPPQRSREPGQAEAQIHALVAEKVAAGTPRDRATMEVYREHPDLRQQWIDEANQR